MSAPARTVGPWSPLACVLFFCCSIPCAANADRRADLANLGTRVELHSPSVSPDGKKIAVVTTRANYADNRFERELVLVDTATGAQRVLASGHAGPNSPQWSPQGDRIAWLEARDGSEPQLYVLSMRDDTPHAVRITGTTSGVKANAHGIESYAWSPDGQSIAYISPDPKPEPLGEERYNKSFEVVDNDYLATEPPKSFHVWLVSAMGGDPRALTSGAASVTGIGWARDGKSILFVSQPRPHNSKLDFAEFMDASSSTTSLRTVDIAGGAEHVIVPSPGRIWSAPKAAPTGALAAYSTFRGPEPWTHPHDVTVIDTASGTVRNVTTGLDRDIHEFEWLPGPNALLVTAPDGPRWGLWLQSPDGISRRIDLGSVIELSGLSVGTKIGAVAFVGSESRLPPEIYVMTSINAKPRRLTHFNDQLAALNLGRTETIKWRLDGFDQTGVLIYPPDFSTGEKYPLVLNIHGGPEGTSTQAFDLLDQIFAAQGWLVFKPNYRGSDSQGDAFQSSIINDLGDGPGRDVMAGLAAVKALGVVDEKRVAVSGWSYGGYMTVWLIGHYQGWSSAVAGAPLTNLIDWYSLSCCNAWADPALGGSPWLNNNFTNYWRQSPISYADRVRTPTLILQNMGDPEVPYTGSYSLYRALRDNGVPVKFVVYPLQGHGFGGEPVQQRDTLRRWIAWIDEHFRAPAQASR